MPGFTDAALMLKFIDDLLTPVVQACTFCFGMVLHAHFSPVSLIIQSTVTNSLASLQTRQQI